MLYERIHFIYFSELMFELRRIQHGERPVTGKGNKEAVEQFFHRALNTDEAEPEAPDANRPEHVVVEVNALVERRPVSSVLQSSGFRRNLEHALRGAMLNISRRPPPQPRTPAQATPPQTVRNEQATSPSPPPRSASPVPAPRDLLRTRMQLRRQEAQSLPTPAPRTSVPPPPPVPSVEESETEQSPDLPSGSFAEAWLRQGEQNNFNAG